MAASAVLQIGAKIASKTAGAMKGVAKSSKRLTKSVQKNIKIKKRLRATSERFQKYREEKKKRQEKENNRLKKTNSNFLGSIFLNFGLWTLEFRFLGRKFEIYVKNHP